MKHSEIYNAAAALIEKGWTQHALARTIEGFTCHPNSPLARSWCLTGALKAVSGDLIGPALVSNLLDHARLGEAICLPSWNDNPCRTKKQVIARLLKAVTTLPSHA